MGCCMEVAHRDGEDLETLLLLILQEGPWAGMLRHVGRRKLPGSLIKKIAGAISPLGILPGFENQISEKKEGRPDIPLMSFLQSGMSSISVKQGLDVGRRQCLKPQPELVYQKPRQPGHLGEGREPRSPVLFGDVSS